MGISKRKALQLTAILFTVVVVLALMVFLIKVYRYVQAPDKKAFDFIGPEVALIVKVDNFKAIKDLEQSEQNFLPLFFCRKTTINCNPSFVLPKVCLFFMI